MTTIRPYIGTQDYEMVATWWRMHGQPAPRPTMLPDTTYILELDGVPAVCACLYLMNCPEASAVENLVVNPAFQGPERKEAVSQLITHLEKVAKERGHTHIVLFSYEPKLKARYEELGFIKTLENVTTYSKEL